jgi:hypothetical protein
MSASHSVCDAAMSVSRACGGQRWSALAAALNAAANSATDANRAAGSLAKART